MLIQLYFENQQSTQSFPKILCNGQRMHSSVIPSGSLKIEKSSLNDITNKLVVYRVFLHRKYFPHALPNRKVHKSKLQALLLLVCTRQTSLVLSTQSYFLPTSYVYDPRRETAVNCYLCSTQKCEIVIVYTAG